MKLRRKDLRAIPPAMALLLTVEAMASPVFADPSGLAETDKEPVIVPHLKGVHSVGQWWRVNLGHHTNWGGIQLSWAEYTHRSFCQQEAVGDSVLLALVGALI